MKPIGYYTLNVKDAEALGKLTGDFFERLDKYQKLGFVRACLNVMEGKEPGFSIPEADPFIKKEPQGLAIAALNNLNTGA